MQLIMATDYAIRALLYLSLVGRMAPASEVSEKMHIPKQYLVTMSRRLKDAGLIDAESGASGGYFLARPADKITVLDIVQVTEGTGNLNRCVNSDQYCECEGTGECPVREVYENLQTTVEELLGGVTLADLKEKKLKASSARKEKLELLKM